MAGQAVCNQLKQIWGQEEGAKAGSSGSFLESRWKLKFIMFPAFGAHLHKKWLFVFPSGPPSPPKKVETQVALQCKL